MTDFDLSKYIYWEFSLVVLIATELIRFFLSKLPGNFVEYIAVKEPKWITLIVASVLMVLDWMFIGSMNSFHIWQKIISFGVAVLGYDYVWKLIKDAFAPLIGIIKERIALKKEP